MPTRVVFYQTPSGRSPVEDFLNGLTHRQRAKALDALEMLDEAGYYAGPPWLKKIDADLWELRVWAGGVRLRFLFCQEGAEFVILHGLKKKADRLPERDLETARHRCREYRAR